MCYHPTKRQLLFASARLESSYTTSVGDQKNACCLISKSAGKAETLVGVYNRADVEYKGVDWI